MYTEALTDVPCYVCRNCNCAIGHAVNWPICKNGSSNGVIYIGQVFASMQSMETATNSGGISWPCSRFPPVIVPIPTLLEFTNNFALLPGATGKGCLE